jgi:hypothetical protein
MTMSWEQFCNIAADQSRTDVINWQYTGKRLHPTQAIAPLCVLPLLRQHDAAQAWRGRDRDAGGDPAAMEVIQPVREKFSCRACEHQSP